MSMPGATPIPEPPPLCVPAACRAAICSNNWSTVAGGLPTPVGTLTTVVTTNLTVGGDVWGFDGNGALTFPDATTQTTAYTGIPGPYADDEAAALAGVALGSPYHKTGTGGQVFVRLTSPT